MSKNTLWWHWVVGGLLLVLLLGATAQFLVKVLPSSRTVSGFVTADRIEATNPELILELVNKAREDAKLPALKANPVLMKMARDHAANMAKQEKSEDLLDGKDHAMRLAEAGYKIKDKMSQANLVSADAAVLKDASIAVGAWLEVDDSKANILGKYTETGIGVAISDKKIAYYYQVFAVPEE